MSYSNSARENTTLALPKRKEHRQGVGVGTTSLLVIFTLLCLATLAFLSISVASNNRSTNQRSLESIRNLSVAEGVAAKTLSTVDTAIATINNSYKAPSTAKITVEAAAIENYYQEIEKALRPLGCTVNAETRTASFTVPIDENHQLVTEVLILEPSLNARYMLNAQYSRMIGEWKPDDEGKLWIG